jgi:ketosteroid isomerase-like protein
MNRVLALAAVSAVLICPCRDRQGGQPPPADAQQHVRASVDRFGDAFLKADVDALDALLTDDYVHTNLSGTVLDKTRWLNYVKSRRGEIKSGKLKVGSYVNDGIVVRVYGDAAVVTGRNVTKGAREGKAFTTRLRFTQVWVKQSGRWRRAGFHDSALPEEADAR